MKSSFIFELNLARRFLEENKIQTFLIVMGITIGVAVMVFLTALIDGLQADLIKKTVGKSPHLVITSTETTSLEAVRVIDQTELLVVDTTQNTKRPIVEWRTIQELLTADVQIRALLPVVEGSGLIRRGDVSRGVLLRGADIDQADRIYGISSAIIAGNNKPVNGAILIGKDLAIDMGISPGDPIILELPDQKPLSLIVDGVFDMGISAINQRWLVMDRHQAGVLLGIGDKVTSIEAQVFDIFSSEKIARTWDIKLPACKIESWQETNAQLLSALRSQSSSSYTIQFFVLLAVTLGVASVLAINAVQKYKQIGILKAMGIRTSSVANVFMLQGIIMAIMGILLGFSLGFFLTKIFLLLTGQQFMLVLNPTSIAIIMITTIAAATLSAYLPARRVSQLNPVEVIRNG